MIKREKKRRLHGSVLLTVVCVMSILIVFLFGTLALATAANNRAHVNYSTAQTEVTSRTVVDAAIKAMVASPDYANAVAVKGTADDPAPNIPLKVNVQIDGNVPNAGKYGDVLPVTIQPSGKKKFYDSDKKEWIDGDILKFTSVVSMAGVDSTTSAYIVKQPPTKGNGNGGGGAGYVTTAGTSIDCSTFLAGGAYINLPMLGEDKNSNKVIEADDTQGAVFYDYTYRTDTEYENNWNEKKDDGSDNANYDPTLYRQFAPYGSSGATTFKFSNTPSGAEADLYVINNVDMYKCDNIVFPGESKGITVWGDMIFSQDTQTANYVFKNITTTNLAFNKMPYVYVDGEITGIGSNSIIIGDTSSNSANSPLNIFCGNIVLNGSNNVKINGDIYCMNPNKKSIIKPSNSTQLYSWTGSVINKTGETGKDHTASSIYSQGELEIGKMVVGGDVRVEKDCRITGKTTIEGNLVVGENLIIDEKVTVKGNVIVKGELKINSGKLKLGKDSKIYCDSSKATGLDSGVEADPKYVERSTFPHNASEYPNAEEVTNGKRYYLEYKAQPKPGEDPNQQYGLLDEPGVWHANNVTYYYKWKEDFDPIAIFGLGADDPSYYCNPETFKSHGLNIADFIEPGYQKDNWNDYRPHNPVDNSIMDYYYVEKVWDDTWGYVTKSVPTDKEKYYVDPTDNHKIITDFRTVPDADGNDKFATSHSKQDTMAEFALSHSGYDANSTSVWFDIDTGDVVAPATAAPGSVTTYAVPDNTEIYPEYAKRGVILGIDTIPGIAKENTQIVKTIAEVLETVANPYKDGQLSTQLSAQYEEVRKKIGTSEESNVYFTNITDILKANNKYATNVKTNGSYETKTPVLNGDVNNDTFSGGYNSPGGVAEGAIITNDCILNIDGMTSKCKYLIFEPGTKDILVVVDKLSLDNIPIMVNDSEGGTVNFYIENDSKFYMASQDWIAPTSYLKAFADDATGALRYNSDDTIDSTSLNDLGKPKINIYGKPRSEFTIANFQFMIANIISSDLLVDIDSTNGVPSWASFDSIYYNDVDIKGINGDDRFVIGCINSNYTKIPNQLNVVYVTDEDSDNKDPLGNGKNAFNYRILYYDEY